MLVGVKVEAEDMNAIVGGVVRKKATKYEKILWEN